MPVRSKIPKLHGFAKSLTEKQLRGLRLLLRGGGERRGMKQNVKRSFLHILAFAEDFPALLAYRLIKFG